MESNVSSLVFLQYLTTVFDNVADAILLIGVEEGAYRFLMANPAFFEVSGYPRDAVGKEVSSFTTKDTYHFLVKQYQRVIRSKKPTGYTRWTDVPGGRKAFEVRMIPILNTVGECVQIAALTRDVSEITTLREQVKQLSAELAAAKDQLTKA